MRRFSIKKQFDFDVPISERVAEVMRMFGLTIDRLKENAPRHTCDFSVEQGDIVYITGPSGAGKSVLLREIRDTISQDERICLDEIELPADKGVIDCFSNSMTTLETLRLLSIAGLGDAFCVLTPPAMLSEGQQYRFRLACCLAAGKKFIIADEFASSIDRITAAVVAYNLHKFAKRNKVTIITASCREDIIEDLKPDVLVVKYFTGPAEVTYKKFKT
jgi:ABC-type ATPase with predicted acetyltransferase domain